MARITSDPGLLDCPDFASPTYALVQAPLINDNTTEAQAIQLLKDVWSVGNEADKIRWQLQNDEDQAAHDERLRLQAEADDLRAQAEVEEAEATRKDEVKKNKSKSRGHRHRKKIYWVDFFAKAFSSGLTNYVIRHNS